LELESYRTYLVLRGGKLDEYLKRWEVYAPQSYQKIRETDDISIIAKNAGFSQITISLNLSGGIFYGFLCNVN